MLQNRRARGPRFILAQAGFRKPISWFRNRRLRAKETSELRSLVSETDRSIWFQQERPMLLHKLFDLYGSDKGSVAGRSPYYPWRPHSYADVYSSLFDHCRNSIKVVFECGIGTNRPEFVSNMSEEGRPGASLRAWRDYFPHAEIIGADVDSSVLFEEDRIRTFYVDQTDPSSIADMWEQAGGPVLDFVVDDGLHSLDAATTLLKESWHLLRQGGLYIIEDVQVHQLDSYRRYFAGFPAWVSYVIFPVKNDELLNDNCIIILRKTTRQGSTDALPHSG